MANVTYQGTGQVLAADYIPVRWVGKTKGGKNVTITLPKALNMSNIDLSFQEKNDTVAALTFTAVYSNTDAMISDTTEPWTIVLEDGVSAGAGEILLNTGIFYVNNVAVALTRGGGSFNVARTFRNINADDDMGPVENRVVITDSIATLTLNALTWLTKVADYFPAMSST